MDSPSVSVWEEEEKGTIVFAELPRSVGLRAESDGSMLRKAKGAFEESKVPVIHSQLRWTQGGWAAAEGPKGTQDAGSGSTGADVLR